MNKPKPNPDKENIIALAVDAYKVSQLKKLLEKEGIPFISDKSMGDVAPGVIIVKVKTNNRKQFNRLSALMMQLNNHFNRSN